jgi:dolichol-phosphate mannosyltransferase
MKTVSNPTVSIVIPIMNEEGNIARLIERLRLSLAEYGNHEIIFVDDGSNDETLSVIKKYREDDKRIKFLSFSRNFGHQSALKAGLDASDGDCVISMDGDLQHPPELINEMISIWMQGYDIVYTVRQDKNQTSLLKRKTSQFFYKLLNRLSDIQIDQGVADFRLLDRNIVDMVSRFQENPLFFRGIIKWMGFRQYALTYSPEQRSWGVTKYSFRKMMRFAVLGITSFSVKPLQISTVIGTIIAIKSLGYGIYALLMKILTDATVPGWTSMLIIVSFIGGIQLIMLGILGVYLGKLFIESKRRPSYLVKEQGLEG